jgi:hypothetical protein
LFATGLLHGVRNGKRFGQTLNIAANAAATTKRKFKTRKFKLHSIFLRVTGAIKRLSAYQSMV